MKKIRDVYKRDKINDVIVNKFSFALVQQKMPVYTRVCETQIVRMPSTLFPENARIIARRPSVESRKSSSEAGVGCAHLISKRLSRLKRTLAANTRVINYCYASVLRSLHRALNGNN